MIEAILGHDAAIAEWVSRQPPFDPHRGFGNCAAIGWAENGRLIGGTVFHDYEPRASIVEMSSAAVSPRWLTARSLNRIFGYVFDQLHCQMVVMRVSHSNARMCSIARRFGFADALIRRLYGPDEDGHVFTLTAEEWMAHPVRCETNGQAAGSRNPER